MRRLLSSVLSIVMTCALVPAPALAEAADELAAMAPEGIVVEEDPAPDPDPAVTVQSDLNATYTDPDGVTYELEWATDGSGLAIANIIVPAGEGSIDLVLPGTITYQASDGSAGTGTVSAVKRFCWNGDGRARVRSVTIPNTITTISGEFGEVWPHPLSNLETVTFEPADESDPSRAGVSSLPNYFFDRSVFSSVTLPTGLESIGKGMFSECQNLTSITIPSSVTSIGEFAFYNCNHLQSITFNEGLKSIDKYAFYGHGVENNIPLTTVEFPNSLETIADHLFFRQSALGSVSFGTSLTESHLQSIGDNAFESTSLTEVSIPNSVTSIGAWAFAQCCDKNINDGGRYTLQTVNLGSSQEESQLQTIGDWAFKDSQITTIALPNKLTYYGGSTALDSKSAFFALSELTTIVWPTQPPADGLGLTHVYGFDECRKLSGDVIGAIPSWITTIDDHAFHGCGLTSATIPASITSIGVEAFAGEDLQSLVFEEGNEPLTIAYQAFNNDNYMHGLRCGEVVLPERVVSLADDVFGGYATFYVRNKDIQIPEGARPWADKWGEPKNVVYYPDEASEDSDIVRTKNLYESQGNGVKFHTFELHPKHSITGTVPEGATITLTVNGATADEQHLDGTDFSARALAGASVVVTVSVEGYASYSIMPTSGTLDDDWTFAVTTTNMVPLSNTGELAVTVTKPSRPAAEQIMAAIGCNVVVLNAAGQIAARGVTSTSTMFFAHDLPAGTYTVIAFDKNEYFSAIPSADELERLGVQPDTWATQEVTIEAHKTTELELPVPDLQIMKAKEILESGSIAVADAHVVPTLPFTVRVSFLMKEGHAADSVSLAVPDGAVVDNVATLRRSYGTSGFDPTSRILTVQLQEGDTESTTVYVTMHAVAGRNQPLAFSAAVQSGAATAPLGSALVDVPAVLLEVPSDELLSPTFKVEVYAAPKTEVRFRIGNTDLSVTAQTNSVGHGTAELTIPEEELGTFSLYSVTAYVSNAQGGEDSTTEAVWYYLAAAEEFMHEHELSFVHGGKTNYLVKDGEEIPNAYYVCIALAGHAPDLYSATWPFKSVIDSKRSLATTATLMLKMLNGSIRYETMTLASVSALDDGTNRYTYMASVPIGDGNPNHDLLAKDIPCGFEVIPAFENMDEELTPPALTQANVNTIKRLQAKDAATWVERLSGGEASQGASVQSDENEDAGTFVEHIFGKGYKRVKEGLGRMADDDVRQLLCSTTRLSKQKRAEFVQKYQELDELCAEYESLVEQTFDAIQQLTADSKPMYAYDSEEEYLRGEFSYQTGVTLTPAQLEARGYTVVYDNDPSSVPGAGTYDYATDTVRSPAWIAFRATLGTSDAQVHTQDDGDVDPSGCMFEVYDAFGTYVHKYVSDIWNHTRPADAFWTLIDTLSQIRNGIEAVQESAGTVAEWFVREYKALPADLQAGIGAAPTAKGVKARISVGQDIVSTYLGPLAFAVQQISNDFTLYNNRTESLQLATHYSTLDSRMQSFIDSGRTNTKCYQMLRAEQAALSNYKYDLDIQTAVTATDSVVGIALVTCGVLCIPPAGTFIAITGLVMYAGVEAYNGINSGYMSGHQQDYEAKKSLREAVCGDKKNTKHNSKVGIDPSGYVYEGVEGNRVEGAVATLQYSTDNGETWLSWDDAADYEQANPQTTDSAGLFAWDVPMGLWRVTISAPGYEDAHTAGMEVPPARTGLAIALRTLLAPSVASVTCDDHYLEVVFKQYMNMDAVPSVTMAGIALTGGEWTDPTTVSAASDVQYARVWRVPVPDGTRLGSTLPVTVGGAVNYAGTAMEAVWEGDVLCTSRPHQIALDYDGVVPAQVGTHKDVAAYVLDANGKPIPGASVVATGSIAEFAAVAGAEARTDASGATSFQVDALLPGTSKLKLSVEGTSLSRTVDLVTTIDANACARPTATVGTQSVGVDAPEQNSLTVVEGDEVSLSCATDGAIVYYTTDGSDPRLSASARRAYTEPLVLTKNVNVIVVAYKDGMDYSDSLRLSIAVKRSLAKATVAAIPAQTYTGKALTPAVTVKYGSTKLKKGTDYTVAYSKNVNAGTAMVTITGKGNYAGTVKKTFAIGKATQTITAADVECVTGKTVKLGAKASGGGKLTYKSSSAKVATVSAKGVVSGKKAGTAKVTITAVATKNWKKATKTVTVKVGKANPIVASAAKKVVSVAYAKVKSKAQVTAANVRVSKAQGAVSFSNASTNATARKFKVDASTGKVTAPKKTKKGKYAVVIAVTAAGNKSYISGTKSVSYTLQVK